MVSYSYVMKSFCARALRLMSLFKANVYSANFIIGSVGEIKQIVIVMGSEERSRVPKMVKLIFQGR